MPTGSQGIVLLTLEQFIAEFAGGVVWFVLSGRVE
jgi:hypothetical protein